MLKTLPIITSFAAWSTSKRHNNTGVSWKKSCQHHKNDLKNIIGIFAHCTFSAFHICQISIYGEDGHSGLLNIAKLSHFFQKIYIGPCHLHVKKTTLEVITTFERPFVVRFVQLFSLSRDFFGRFKGCTSKSYSSVLGLTKLLWKVFKSTLEWRHES
jgi:hypothetical protein